MGKIYGYIRVSTKDQQFHLQKDALLDYGCHKIFEEKESGRKTDRDALTKLLKRANSGDTIVVWKLDRLARTTYQLITLTEKFQKKNISLISLKEKIDTRTPMGRFYFTIMAGIAEMEVEMLRERTKAGLEAARKRGKIGGRPTIKNSCQKRIQQLYLSDKSITEIAKECNISKSTAHKYVHLLKKKSV